MTRLRGISVLVALFHFAVWTNIIKGVLSSFAAGGGNNQSKRFSSSSSSSSNNNGNPNRSNDRKSSNYKRQGYLKRSAGVKTKRKKPPKWEQEGDELFFLPPDNANNYANNQNADRAMDNTNNNVFITDKTLYSTPKQLLESTFGNRKEISLNEEEDKEEDSLSSSSSAAAPVAQPSPFLWGGVVPCGPILAPKLNALWKTPTPIQIEAFKMLSKSSSRDNVVMASPTGSGKTLAYLLPLLATIHSDKTKKLDNTNNNLPRIIIVTPTLDLAYQIQRVVHQLWGDTSDNINLKNNSMLVVTSKDVDSDDHDENDNYNFPIIVSGTPKTLLTWLSHCRRKNNQIKVLEKVSNIILDEADRLLQTELVARQSKTKFNIDKNNIDKKNNRKKHQVSVTWKLLQEMTKSGVSLDAYTNKSHKARLICASATVGRTLRRQIMEFTGASSIDKAAILLTADLRTKKDKSLRHSSLLPSTITHYYTVYDADMELTDAIYSTLRQLPPVPILLFPGKSGVTPMVEKLNELGLNRVYTLKDDVHFVETEKEEKEVESNDDNPTPIVFVVGEKFARGLDIPSVKYVILISPPTSAAAYAQLAGRTGRAGQFGHCITFVKTMTEARRFVSLAQSLHLSISQHHLIMQPVLDEFNQPKNEMNAINAFSEQDENKAIQSLTVVQLKEELRRRGLKLSGKKDELIQRLLLNVKIDS